MTVPQTPLTTLMQEHRNQLRQEWPWVWLYELEVPTDPVTRVRLTNMPQPVTFGVDSAGAPITYAPFPIVHGGIKKTASGDIPTMGVSIANVTREIGLLFDRHDGLDGAPAVIRLVNMADLDNPKAQLEERAEVRGCSVKARIVTVTLSAYSLYRAKVPSQRYVSSVCRYAKFGDEQCGYRIPASPGETVGTGFSTCSRRRTDCEERGEDEAARGLPQVHPKRWGAFPGMRRQLGGA